MPETLLSSAAVAQALGVGVSAVKRWADAGLLRCVKTAGGHRRFSRRDLEQFRTSTPGAADPWSHWIDTLQRGEMNAILALLFGERATRGAWHGVAEHLGPLLFTIGERWARGELTVAQEHLATSSLQRALAVVAETLPVVREAPRCVLAAAEGEEHSLGLSLAELCLREQGWRAEWLGTPTRPVDVTERVKAGADMVALSASSVMSDRRALRAQVRSVGHACQRAGIPLILGGAGRWPDPPAFGVRLERWSDFQARLRAHAARAGRAR